MGQTVHVTIFAPSDDHAYEAAAAALTELRRVEACLSVFDDASELAELNRHAGRAPMRVGTDLLAVLRAAAASREASHGAFDLAVEPLMRAWGFRAARADAPTAVEIGEAEAAVRSATVEIEGSFVRLPAAHTRLDTGGIGVGYGLDRAVGELMRHGIQRALVDISGDCYAIGAPPGADGWNIAIAGSDRHGNGRRVVTLRDAALATSANSASAVRFGNRSFGHVMDPATGYPAAALRQVTVVARSGIAADALSTAALVSGRRPAGALLWHPIAS